MDGDREDRIAAVTGELREVQRDEGEVEQLEGRLEQRETRLNQELVELELTRTYEIKVNRDSFAAQPRFINGRHILQLVSEDDGKHGVAILRGGSEHDVPVGLGDTVDLEHPQNRRFKTFALKSTEGL